MYFGFSAKENLKNNTINNKAKIFFEVAFIFFLVGQFFLYKPDEDQQVGRGGLGAGQRLPTGEQRQGDAAGVLHSAAAVGRLVPTERLAALERFRRPPEGAARGAWVDLGESFRRVNRDYFDGALPAPQLAWSRRVRRQEFGRYDAPGDT
ncbi:MAG: hypothetical protein HGB12_10335, partial [Bacteroidetes bacterium]|nr:hypothetical protein [Bacteroidota bacterium]